MKRWFKHFTMLFFLLSIIAAGAVSSSSAAGFGHHQGSAVNLLSSLEPPLSTTQIDELKSVLSSYGPTLKTLWQQLRAAKSQLNTLAKATPPSQTAIPAQAQVVAGLEAQIALQRAQLHSALNAVLTTEQTEQLTAQLRAKFERTLDTRIDYLLMQDGRYLENQ